MSLSQLTTAQLYSDLVTESANNSVRITWTFPKIKTPILIYDMELILAEIYSVPQILAVTLSLIRPDRQNVSKASEKIFNINNIQCGKKVFKPCPIAQKFMVINGETNFTIRNHPCNINLPIIQLPDRLDRAAAKYLRDNVLMRPKDIQIQANSLRNSLWSRILLIEKNVGDYIRKKIKAENMSQTTIFSEEIMKQIINQNDPDIEELILSNASNIMNMHKKDVDRIIDREMADSAVPIRYSKNLSDLYLVSRLAPNFSASCRVMYEIRKRCPKFSPINLFDFGSGIGSTVWAANTIWPSETIKHHFLVDASTNMLSISEYLLKDGLTKHYSTAFPGITHRSYLPASSDVKYDLVVSCYSLLDVSGGYMNRRSILTNLWKKTEKFLICIEPGTKAGFQAILEARDWLINSTKDEDNPAKIFAPCPHSMDCPKRESVCSFPVRFEDLRLTESVGQVKSEMFSYIILHKGDLSQYQNDMEIYMKNYPRIVSYKCEKEVQDLCSSDGSANRYFLQMKDRSLKRFIRKCQPGDLMPVALIDDKIRENDQNQ